MKARLPSAYPFGSAEWIRAWVEQRIAETGGGADAARAGLTAIRAVCLHGSIGYNSALAVDGSVWLNEYDPTSLIDETPWQEISGLERSWIIVLATRQFPELKGLLPLQPRRASTCARCKGSGFILQDTPCRECGALGWRSTETT